MKSTALGGFLNLAALLTGAGGGNDSMVTTLLVNPTVTAMSGPMGMLGTYGGDLFVHLTAATDISWLNLSLVDIRTASALVAGQNAQIAADARVRLVTLADNPTVVNTPGIAGTIGIFDGGAYLRLGPTVDAPGDKRWIWLAGELASLVADAAAIFNLSGDASNVVRSAVFDVSYALFRDAALVQTVTLLVPELKVGAILVGATAHVVSLWDGPAVATVSIEFDDQRNGTAYVIKPFDGTDTTAGGTIGRAAFGGSIVAPTCTVRTTGANVAALTSGSVRLEIFYKVPT